MSLKTCARLGYYPFGSQNQNSWTRPNASNKFLYNQGGELNKTSGLYDLSLRNYDPLLGRFLQVDPMAASFHNKSVYLYAGNNPTNVNDPSGGAESADPTGMWGNQSRLAEWANSISYGYGTATDGSSLGHGNGGGGLHSKYFGMSDKNVLKAAKSGDPEALGEYLDRLAAAGYSEMYQMGSTQSATFLNNLTKGTSLSTSLANVAEGDPMIASKNMTIESILRQINKQSIGYKISGKDIAAMNDKLGMAETVIKSIEKVNGGLQVKFTLTGRAIVGAAPNISVSNGAIFNLSDVTTADGASALQISSPESKLYGDPLNAYIRGDTYSLGGQTFFPIFGK